MANETYPLKHVVVPVLHPSGNVDQIAVPENTPVADLHDALSDYYHEQPSASSAVENSDSFKQAAQEAWKRTAYGQNPLVESGFAVDKNGQSVMAHTETSPKGAVPSETLKYPPGAVGVLHTHPDSTSPRPSQNDIDAAKRVNKTVWVASKRGLFSVNPTNGEVTQVYNDPDWMKAKR
jgi:proteasome lid subunit RPN8/RPN11